MSIVCGQQDQAIEHHSRFAAKLMKVLVIVQHVAGTVPSSLHASVMRSSWTCSLLLVPFIDVPCQRTVSLHLGRALVCGILYAVGLGVE